MSNKLSIETCMIKGYRLLKEHNIENSKNECLLILQHILQKNSAFLYANPKYSLSNEQYSYFMHCIEERCHFKPLQYILGSQEFMGLDFAVTPDVLIPRQDTEILVESILNHLPHKENISVLDIGTGSGCICISIAHFAKNTKVLALDVSDAALNVAYSNAEHNNVLDKVFFLKSNLFEQVKILNLDSKDFFGRNIPNIRSIIYDKFDIIVSNPPYISSNDMLSLHTSVSNFEPHLALFGGVDGLDFYRKITSSAKDFLCDGGLLAFEVGYNQSDDVYKILKTHSFKNLSILPDLNHINRVVLGFKKNLL
ncbi:MAG: peptide chain release factor N(5)-glutamine methyltransferase [Clostridiales bacterium]|nr:peptide chain release factor N(5)-glutamine methyltransferase [Clostridiales bacterium]